MSQFDPNFGSALEAAAAIKARKISSVELTRTETLDRFAYPAILHTPILCILLG